MISNLSVSDLVYRIKSKQVSVVEVVQHYINQIEKTHLDINALVQDDFKNALDTAKAFDKLLINNRSKGTLFGIPFTIKNACQVKGLSPDKGSYGLRGTNCQQDATIVKRLRKEGAILLGLSNCPEFSIGYETDNILYGRTNNPYNLNKTPGGSSGGEAALISAGASPLGIGSDASGSIRVPAHYTGIAAMKATQGLIPITGNIPNGAAGLFSQFFSFGPMGNYVDDLAIVLKIIAGPDDRDPHVVPVCVKDYEKVDVSRIRVAYYVQDGVSQASNDTVIAINNAKDVLNPIVSCVHEDAPPELAQVDELMSNSIMLGGDEGKWLLEILDYLKVDKISPLLQQYLELSKECKFSVTELRKQWQLYDQYRTRFLSFMDNYDVIICPVASTSAREHGTTFSNIKDYSYTMAYSLVNFPVVVVQCGVDKAGLPIGAQIVAKPFRDDVALAVAHLLEKKLSIKLKKQAELIKEVFA